MKRPLNLLALFVLAACADRQATPPPSSPIVIPTKIISTNTSLPSAPPPPTSTVLPTQVPCDLFHSDFCIAEGHFILQRPILPPDNGLVDPTYRYASTANGTREPHHGVEFANPGGTPVHAAADGTVVFAGADTKAIYSPWRDFYGKLVVVEHADELYTLYAHLSRIDVAAGQQVRAGDRLGDVGRTGGAIGSHLHFEVRRGDDEDYFATQNPELWLSPPLDTNGNSFGVLEMSIMGSDQKLIRSAEFTLQYFPDPSGPVEKSFYGSTYSADMLHGTENAVLGELPAGQYRIVVKANGQFYERRVEVESGKLTQVIFVVN